MAHYNIVFSLYFSSYIALIQLFCFQLVTSLPLPPPLYSLCPFHYHYYHHHFQYAYQQGLISEGELKAASIMYDTCKGMTNGHARYTNASIPAHPTWLLASYQHAPIVNLCIHVPNKLPFYSAVFLDLHLWDLAFPDCQVYWGDFEPHYDQYSLS